MLISRVFSDLAIPSRRLDAQLCVLLGDFIQKLIESYIPVGYRETTDLLKGCEHEIEKMMRAFQPVPSVSSG